MARQLLPMLGGTPAVWSTAMLFFQASLLVGYLLAHAAHRARKFGRIGVVALLGFAAWSLPIGLPGWAPPTDRSPVFWALGAMALGVGLPFVALSMTNPLIQAWLSRTRHGRAADPYPLYAASNAGSLLGLVAYPLIVEPNLTLRDQRTWWSAAFVVFILAICACAFLTRERGGSTAAGVKDEGERAAAKSARLPARGVARWILLAAVPSGLMLAVTQHISTDIAPVPLLWVLPLSLYLLSFVIAFSKSAERAGEFTGRLAPIALVVTLLLLLLDAGRPIVILITLHLVSFAILSVFLHCALARLRPAPARLTEYYIFISVGGVLGGLFVSIVAPAIFNDLYEYPALLAAAATAGAIASKRSAGASGEEAVSSRGAAALLHRFAPAVVGLSLLAGWVALYAATVALAGRGIDAGLGRVENDWIPACVAAVACYLCSARPRWFAPACAAFAVVAAIDPDPSSGVVERARSYFGVHRVERVDDRYLKLMHGATVHGVQLIDESSGDMRSLPTTYYHPTGPIGQVFSNVTFAARLRNIGLIGMGAGSLAAYATPAMTLDFFEVDPTVVRIARDSGRFTFLRGSNAAKINYILGDGRITIAREPAEKYDLIVVDAFGSDAVPVHLLTREAFELYVSRLAPGGIVAVHISNWHLDLRPVVGAVVRDAGLAGCVQHDEAVLPEQEAEQKSLSTWVLVARTKEDLLVIARDARWLAFEPTNQRAWTDDYSNILSVLNFGR